MSATLVNQHEGAGLVPARGIGYVGEGLSPHVGDLSRETHGAGFSPLASYVEWDVGEEGHHIPCAGRRARDGAPCQMARVKDPTREGRYTELCYAHWQSLGSMAVRGLAATFLGPLP